MIGCSWSLSLIVMFSMVKIKLRGLENGGKIKNRGKGEMKRHSLFVYLRPIPPSEWLPEF